MSTVVKDLGAVSAYAYAVEKGYTGTEAEFAELMASYADVGQTAVTAAQTATTKASEAATSATTATNKASEATTAATTATNKAAEAQADADAAALDASQALSAASTATTKATEATTAAATAVSAKDDAVSANTAAQSAKTAAQTAQTGAETAAASVQASAAQIQTNADDISELKEDLTTKADLDELYKAFPTDTASGSVASFADGANVPVKSLVVNIDPVQSGSGDPSPDNVRPISGWTGVVVNVTGYNLFDKTKATPNSAINSQGIVISGSYYVSDFIPVKPDTDYYIKNVEVSIHARSLCFYGVDKGFLSAESVSGGDSVHATSFVRHIPTNVYYIRIMAHPDYIDSAGVNYPSTDTDYHSYGGNTYTIQLGQTVYGGTLDVVSGELVIDRAMVDLGSLNWHLSAAGTDHERFTYADSNLLKGSVCLCDRLQTVTYLDMYNHIIDNSIAVHPNAQQVEAYVSAYTDVNSFRSAMTGSQFCYKLATPLTIQLDPHEVTALLGSNNVWADTGDSTVTYRADPTLYISRLTEPDADMIADANITSGQYFMVGNTLYKATANIASGANISPNVNCTRKSLSEALNELNA